MAFDPKTPPSLIASGIGGARGLRAFRWKSLAPVAEVIGASYVRTARKLGMRPGDTVLYVDADDNTHHLQVASIDPDTGWGTLEFPDLAPEAAGKVLDATKATQPEAEAGTLNDKSMTPLRTRQAIDAAKQRDAIYTPQMFGTVAPGVDCVALIRLARDAVKLKGGGVIWLPKIGGVGYVVSGQILVDFSDCLVLLEDDIKLSGTAAGSVFRFAGLSNTQRISNVSLVGTNKPKIDGNALGTAGYVYSLVDNFYCCVIFLYCDNWLIQNVYAYNGLVNCIRTHSCGKGLDIDCDTSHALYDNGHSIDFDPAGTSGWVENNPATSASVDIVRPRAWNCRGLGVAAYGSTRVLVDNPRIWNCGNDDAGAYAVTGGGISIEVDVSNTITRDSRVVVNNPQIDDCYGTGIACFVPGAVVNGGKIELMKKAVVKADPTGRTGSAFWVTGKGSIDIRGTVLSKCQGPSIYGLAVGGFYPSITFDGTIEDGLSNAILGRGVSFIKLSPKSIIRRCGSSTSNYIFIDNTGAGYNPLGGQVIISGTFSENPANISIKSVGDVRIRNADLVNNRLTAGVGDQIVTDIANFAAVQGVVNRDDNAQTQRIVSITALVSVGIADGVAGTSISSPVRNLAPSQPSMFRQGQVSASKAYDPASIPNGASVSTSVAGLTGAEMGDEVAATFSLNLTAGVTLSAFMTAPATALCVFTNNSGVAVDLGNGTLKAIARKSY